jgi:hypothetical protein
MNAITGYINVTTTNNFNCSSLYNFYNFKTMAMRKLVCITPEGNYTLPNSLTPSATPTAVAHKGMSRSEMIGVGIGVALASLSVSTVFGIWIIRSCHL